MRASQSTAPKCSRTRPPVGRVGRLERASIPQVLIRGDRSARAAQERLDGKRHEDRPAICVRRRRRIACRDRVVPEAVEVLPCRPHHLRTGILGPDVVGTNLFRPSGHQPRRRLIRCLRRPDESNRRQYQTEKAGTISGSHVWLCSLRFGVRGSGFVVGFGVRGRVRGFVVGFRVRGSAAALVNFELPNTEPDPEPRPPNPEPAPVIPVQQTASSSPSPS